MVSSEKTKQKQNIKPISRHAVFLGSSMMVSFIHKAIYRETPYSFTDCIVMTTLRGPIVRTNKWSFWMIN